MKLKVVLQSKGRQETQSFEQREVIIGRPDPIGKVDIDLTPDMRVSRQHAKLSYHDSVWWVVDLKSRHGTSRRRGNQTETPVTEYQPIELLPGDELVIGDSSLTLDFKTEAVDPPDLQPIYQEIDEKSMVDADAIAPPPALSEDTTWRVMSHILEIADQVQGQGMFDQCISEIRSTFDSKASHYSILLRQDGELLPFASLPMGRTHAKFSYTLAREAINREKAFRWPSEHQELKVTWTGIVEAMYAPIFSGGEVSGVLFVGTDKPDVHFTQEDIQLLTLIAQSLGIALPRVLPEGNFRTDEYPLIFLSYAHTDQTFVKKFADDMRRRFVRVWFDERLGLGTAWREELAIAIKNADCFVLMMSPDSVKSDSVKEEILIAQSRDKKIIPAMHRTSELPLTISHLQYIPLGEEPGSEEYEEGIRRLVEEIKKHQQENL